MSIEIHTFLLKTHIWKCRLQYGGYFVSASMCYRVSFDIFISWPSSDDKSNLLMNIWPPLPPTLYANTLVFDKQHFIDFSLPDNRLLTLSSWPCFGQRWHTVVVARHRYLSRVVWLTYSCRRTTSSVRADAIPWSDTMITSTKSRKASPSGVLWIWEFQCKMQFAFNSYLTLQDNKLIGLNKTKTKIFIQKIWKFSKAWCADGKHISALPIMSQHWDGTGIKVISHYSDIIMSVIAFQITSVSIVCPTVCSGAEQRKHQSSVSLAFVMGNSPVTTEIPAKGSVTRKMFSFDDVIMSRETKTSLSYNSFGPSDACMRR